jgi:hypothetical protein
VTSPETRSTRYWDCPPNLELVRDQRHPLVEHDFSPARLAVNRAALGLVR